MNSIAIALCCAICLANEPANKDSPKPRDERLNRETPEGTLRVFTIGVVTRNADLIKRTSLPLSEEEMTLLCQTSEGEPPNSKEIKEFKEAVLNMKVRALKSGDKFTLPGKKEIVVGKDEVSEDRMVLVLGDAPAPTRMYKAKGYWWVDPEPLLYARKAMAAAKKKDPPAKPDGK